MLLEDVLRSNAILTYNCLALIVFSSFQNFHPLVRWFCFALICEWLPNCTYCIVDLQGYGHVHINLALDQHSPHLVTENPEPYAHVHDGSHPCLFAFYGRVNRAGQNEGISSQNAIPE
jgi:hypothetical protein